MKVTIAKKLLGLLGVERAPAGHAEKFISGVGALIALFAISLFFSMRAVEPVQTALLISSIGASSVLLFAAPHGAMSQPWPVFGGHLFSALAGISCAMLIGDPLLAGPLAVGSAILMMFYLRCLHPPGGATSLAGVAAVGQDGTGFEFVVDPVLSSVLLILIVATLFNYPFPWRRYPASLVHREAPAAGGDELSEADIRYAVEKLGSFIDVTDEDLAEFYRLAAEHAHAGDGTGQEFICLERGVGTEWLSQRLETADTGGPVLYKVISLRRRPDGSDMVVWSKYGLDGEEPGQKQK